MTNNDLIELTKHFVKVQLKDAEGGHDWFHVERVYNNAVQISKGEQVDPLVVALGALLHDIADSKFHDGDESVGPRLTREFLFTHNVDSLVIEHVVNIVKHVSYSSSLNKDRTSFSSPELQVIQDADRLDALGAIGIARAFNYGGFKNMPIFDPNIKPQFDLSKEAYKNSTAPTINHFYEKLFLLKDLMHTKTARQLATKRHQFMEHFLDQFYAEWDGKR